MLLLAVLVIGIVGCSGSPPDDTSSPITSPSATSPLPSQEQIEGFWYLESFEVDGVEETVEVGVNTARQPWVDLGNPYLTGNLGCNDFGGVPEDTYTLTDGALKVGEVFKNAAFCVNEGEDPTDEDAVMVTEETFYGIFEEGIDGIQVAVDGDHMVWTAGNTTLTFSSSDAPPPIPTVPPNPSFGLLDCSPGFVTFEYLDGIGQNPDQLARAAALTVVRVEPEPPILWWGYDENDEVIVGVVKDDITPPRWSIYTCEETG